LRKANAWVKESMSGPTETGTKVILQPTSNQVRVHITGQVATNTSVLSKMTWWVAWAHTLGLTVTNIKVNSGTDCATDRVLWKSLTVSLTQVCGKKVLSMAKVRNSGKKVVSFMTVSG
jgi:hypothetical protein